MVPPFPTKTKKHLAPITLLLILCLFSITNTIEIEKSFMITSAENPYIYTSKMNTRNPPEFQIKLGPKMSLDSGHLFVILESNDLDLYLNIWESSRRKSMNSIKAGTFSGNAIFMLGNGYFDGRLKEFKTKGKLNFALKSMASKPKKNIEYTLKVILSQRPRLDMGKVYTTRLCPSIPAFEVELFYNGVKWSVEAAISKLRFQLNAVRTEKDWNLKSILKYKAEEYSLNTIFKRTVGGVLSAPFFDLCHEDACVYTMTVQVKNIPSLNLETFIVNTIEEVSIHHYESYYDRAYMEDTVIMYKLPYYPEMENLDLTISVIPVTGSTQLYINVGKIPTNEDAYDFKVIGQLAKKSTLSWDELKEMNALYKPIYIAVRCPTPGEYLFRIDAHEKGFKGTLTSGIIEAGSAKFKEITNYMYMFEITKTQEISLELNLEVITGNVDLFLLKCSDYESCMIESEDVEGKRRGLYKKRDGVSPKKILEKFTCEHRKDEEVSLCQFAIGVLGKEEGSSHFEISINDQMNHRLMIPGHSVTVNLEPLTKNYFKFSFPRINTDSSQLFLSIESIWGEFQVYVSKKNEFPNSADYEVHEAFESPKNALFQSMRIIEFRADQLSDNRLEGPYYVAIEALQETMLHMKFYEKGNNQISVHTLSSGKQIRGEITNLYEIMYYTIPVSLIPAQASSVEVNLTPLKGHFVLLGNINGMLPSFKKSQFFSENNRLELKQIDSRKSMSEYLIGVAIHEFPEDQSNILDTSQETFPEENDSFQYMISFSYTNKPLRLSPGIIITSTISKSNLYLIEVLDDFSDLLILKSHLDGFTMQLCGHFSTTDDSNIDAKTDLCRFSTSDKSVSLYLTQNNLKSECQRVRAMSKNHKPKCFFVVEIKGRSNQNFRLGYTYNDRPFQLVKGQIINGPHISDANGRINFVYHAEKNKELGIYFNSKGRNLKIYTKLVRADGFDDSMVINFPTKNNYDSNASKQAGYVQRIYYPQKIVSDFGDQPELLISIRPDENASSFDKEIYDGLGYFVLQTSMETLEISRTQTITQIADEKEYNFFSFYNNGIEESIRVYVMSNNSAALKVMLAPGNKARPPITCNPVISKEGVGSVELVLRKDDLKKTAHEATPSLQGHYMLTVQSQIKTELTLYWNNKQDLDYIELTPNEPNTMLLKRNKKFYFTFYARDIEGGANEASMNLRKDIRIYVKSNVRTNVYVTRSTTGEMEIPDVKNNLWKTSFGDAGGVKSIEISPTDSNYCVNCLYIGYIENDIEGEVTVIANIKHSGTAVELKPGLTFPEYLNPGESTLLRVYDSDDERINLSVSMTTGFVDLFIGKDAEVSQTNYLERHSLESGLSIHKDFALLPEKYNMTGPSEFFILIKNRKQTKAGCTVSIFKNHQRSPLEPGVTKSLHLGEKEKVLFFYQPKADEEVFELRLELTQVSSMDQTFDALNLMVDSLKVHEVGFSGAHLPLDRAEFNSDNNIFYFKYDIGKGNKKVFGIEIKNLVKSSIGVNVDLLNGNYKLINLNSPVFGTVRDEDQQVYEAFGIPDKYMFVELKKCLGEPVLSFYESDFSKVEIGEEVKSKKIEDVNSSVQYMRMKTKNAFFKIESKDSKRVVYTLNAFNEEEMDSNPYFEIGNDDIGRVSIESENGRVVIDSVVLNKFFEKEFRHRITYKMYLSPDQNVAKYAKNCDKQMITRVFEKPEIFLFSQVKHLKVETEKNKARGNNMESRVYAESERLAIEFKNLDKNKKYYGVVVAVVELFPLDPSVLTPVRSTRVYYDEFSIISPHVEFPLKLLVSCAVIIGLLYILFTVIKAYVFGGIMHMDEWKDSVPKELVDVDKESSVGLKGFTMLERAYYFDEKKKKDLMSKSSSLEKTSLSDLNEDDDKKVSSSESLEEHCQEVELQEKKEEDREINI